MYYWPTQDIIIVALPSLWLYRIQLKSNLDIMLPPKFREDRISFAA